MLRLHLIALSRRARHAPQSRLSFHRPRPLAVADDPRALGCVVFIVPAALTADAYTAVYCLTAAMFFLECTIGPSWAVPMDVGGKYSGTVSGMMNMAGNIGGALSPLVFGVLAQLGSWAAPFIVAAGLLVVGSVVWAFWLDPDASVVEQYRLPTTADVAAG